MQLHLHFHNDTRGAPYSCYLNHHLCHWWGNVNGCEILALARNKVNGLWDFRNDVSERSLLWALNRWCCDIWFFLFSIVLLKSQMCIYLFFIFFCNCFMALHCSHLINIHHYLRYLSLDTMSILLCSTKRKSKRKFLCVPKSLWLWLLGCGIVAPTTKATQVHNSHSLFWPCSIARPAKFTKLLMYLVWMVRSRNLRNMPLMAKRKMNYMNSSYVCMNGEFKQPQ